MPRPLVAKHPHPNGELAVQVEVPRFFTRDEAARALALVYPQQSPVRGERGVRDGLSRAARERVLEQAGAAPTATLVAAYKPILDKHWSKFFKYDKREQWVGSGHKRAVKARFDAATLFALEEAAQALALVYSDFVITRTVREDGTVGLDTNRRVGRMTLERGLHQAAEKRTLQRESVGREQSEQDRLEFWRRKAREIGPWRETDPV